MAERDRGFGATTEQQSRERTGNTGRGPKPEEPHGMVGNVVEGAQNLASSVASAAENAWDATRNVAQKAASTVAGVAEDAWDGANNFMRRYPFATLGIGIGLGFLLCMALQSRRS